MSVKNKTFDRDKNNRIRRKYTSRTKHAVHWGAAPKAWRYMYMNRPKRRENNRLCKLLMQGLDPEGAIFPLGNQKPHVYYW